MENENISPVVFGIETIANAGGKSVAYRVNPQEIRRQLNMSQSQFANAFGIPLRTLQGWEQGKRKIDMTTTSYLCTISKFPNEVQAALGN